MAIKIATQAVVTIDSGGVAKQLASSPIAVTSVIIQAEYNNVGRISIGDSTVTTSTGIEIGPGDTFSLTVESIKDIGELLLNDIYVISNTAGDAVRLMIYRRKL